MGGKPGRRGSAAVKQAPIQGSTFPIQGLCLGATKSRWRLTCVAWAQEAPLPYVASAGHTPSAAGHPYSSP